MKIECKVIGVIGKAGAGKDTLYEHIVSLAPSAGLTVHREKFAYPLIDIVSTMSGIFNPEYSHRDLFELRDFKENFELFPSEYPFSTPRQALQYVGTEMMRNMVNENIWIDLMRKRLLRYFKDDLVIITDCRFPNELDFINSIGNSVYVNRESRDGFYLPQFEHSSENLAGNLSSSQVSAILHNNASLVEYLGKINILSKFIFNGDIDKRERTIII